VSRSHRLDAVEAAELYDLAKDLCKFGKYCSYQGRGCRCLHITDLHSEQRYPRMSLAVRENIVSLASSHPGEAQPYDQYKQTAGRDQIETDWKARVVALAKELKDSAPPPGTAPAPRPMSTPHPHPRDSPSPADRDELYNLVSRFCRHGSHCIPDSYEECRQVHVRDLERLKLPAWVRETALNLCLTHPFEHLSMEQYKAKRSEAMEAEEDAWLARIHQKLQMIVRPSDPRAHSRLPPPVGVKRDLECSPPPHADKRPRTAAAPVAMSCRNPKICPGDCGRLHRGDPGFRPSMCRNGENCLRYAGRVPGKVRQPPYRRILHVGLRSLDV
jgi:hypothetical protein